MTYGIIEELRSTQSKNAKISILEKHKNDEILKSVLVYTYSTLINFYTKHQVDVISDHQESVRTVSLGTVINRLDDLVNRKVTGNSSKDFLNDIAIFLTKKDRDVLNLIIARDLDCGINVKTINKVFPNLIPTVPYMRCSSISGIDRIKFPAIVQRKADGIFCNVVIKDRKIKFLTRNGTEFSLDKIGDVSSRFGKYADPHNTGIVLNGELLVLNEEGIELPRKVGNGLINSLIKKDSTLESLREKSKDAKTLRSAAKLKHEIESKSLEFDNTDVALKFVVWDILDYEAWVNGVMNIGYSFRLSHLKIGVQSLGDADCFKIIESKDVDTLEEAQEFYKEQIELGYEGAVLKNKTGIWKNHTSPDQVKLKGEHDCDLIVVGYEPGTGKYTGGIGSLICESSDGKLRVNVGSGLSDADRGFERIDDNDSSKGLALLRGFDSSRYNGTIITVKYNEVITSESKDTHSLFLPRVEELERQDKNEADKLDKILKG